MTRILIVNDSISVQQILKRILLAAKFEIAGIANDGFEAIDLAKQTNPDLILMDIAMPECNGVEATKHIMARDPHPILIVTATLVTHMPHIYKCLNYGAVDVVKTPGLTGAATDDAAFLEAGKELLKKIDTVTTLESQVKKPTSAPHTKKVKSLSSSRPSNIIEGIPAKKLIIIGASSGGPNAVLEVLQSLPKQLDAALIIIQHIDSTFSSGLADWLDINTDENLHIYTALEGDHLIQGIGFLSAKAEDIVIDNSHRIKYESSKHDSIHSPCIDEAFSSAAEIYGKNVIGVLLTGMGRDGATGLKAIKDAGGMTIAQDESTSFIYGMPKAAKDLDAAIQILPLNKISKAIVNWVEEKE